MRTTRGGQTPSIETMKVGYILQICWTSRRIQIQANQVFRKGWTYQMEPNLGSRMIILGIRGAQTQGMNRTKSRKHRNKDQEAPGSNSQGQGTILNPKIRIQNQKNEGPSLGDTETMSPRNIPMTLGLGNDSPDLKGFPIHLMGCMEGCLVDLDHPEDLYSLL